MNTGEFRERVVLQSRVETTDSQGGVSQATTTVATVWAKVTLGSAGSEAMAAGQVQDNSKYLVEIRNSATAATVTTKHQVSWRSKVLNIASVVFSARRDTIELTCAEVG